MKSNSNVKPIAIFDLGDGSFHFNYNIIEVELNNEGVIQKSYDYDTVHVNNTNYETIVSTMIHEKYSIDDELSILRQRNEKQQEFNEYCEYCEQCKLIAKQVL